MNILQDSSGFLSACFAAGGRHPATGQQTTHRFKDNKQTPRQQTEWKNEPLLDQSIPQTQPVWNCADH